MKIVNIIEKLSSIGVELADINLGEFDQIGEFTAKRNRDPNSPLFRSVGATYRANYERGILIYYLIRKFELRSMLEIGFGRGYSTLCAAKAFTDMGVEGSIISIDPNVDENYVRALTQVFPHDWFKHIKIMNQPSAQALPTLNETYDLVYIDGDHSYVGTKLDWELSRSKANKFVLFDDYHLPSKNDPGIECSKLIDEISLEKELIIMDRRIFNDERGYNDNQIDYGQVLINVENNNDHLNDW